MDIVRTIIFSLALFTSIYFYCRFMTWVAFKISPENFQVKITEKDILKINIVGFVSLFLWSLLYYFSL